MLYLEDEQRFQRVMFVQVSTCALLNIYNIRQMYTFRTLKKDNIRSSTVLFHTIAVATILATSIHTSRHQCLFLRLVK